MSLFIKLLYPSFTIKLLVPQKQICSFHLFYNHIEYFDERQVAHLLQNKDEGYNFYKDNSF